MADLDDICARLFDAFSAQDLDAVEAMVSPDATITQNGNSMTWPEAKALIAGLSAALGTFRYTEVRRVVGDDAIVEEHKVVANPPNGSTIELWACVVVRVGGDGLITSLDEYADPTPLSAL